MVIKRLLAFLGIIALSVLLIIGYHKKMPTTRFVTILANPQPITLWTQAFGNKNNPPILLIMGATATGLAWPDSFCMYLASRGYYVIRYDNRDTGASSSIDFDKYPYSLEDLVSDALGVLDAYQLQKAHIVGISMGGFIGQMLAAQHAQRVSSLVSIASSPDHRVLSDAIEDKDTSHYLLPPPDKKALYRWQELKKMPKTTLQEKLFCFLENAKLFAGEKGFNKQESIVFALQSKRHIKNHKAAENHKKAMIYKAFDRTALLRTIKVPTLVIHGSSDAVFPLAHGVATADAIPGATLVVIPEMGHSINNCFAHQVANILIDWYKTIN